MATPTFAPPVNPTTDDEQTKPKVLTPEFGDNYILRAPDGLNPLMDTISLSFKTCTFAEAGVILKFFRDRQGVEAFFYDPPDNLVTALGLTGRKWVCPEWGRSRVQHDVVDITCKLQRVNDPGD